MLRLIAASIHPPIPGESPRRPLVGTFLAAIFFAADMMLLEWLASPADI